ncbi:MAG: spore germination protein [Lachnospiraceae bacterium]|nr:spore germination protein [Lachnospiraceae bacterium]
MFLYEKNYLETKSYLDEKFKNCQDIKQVDVELKYLNNTKGKIYYVEEAVNDITLRDVVLGLSDVEEITGLPELESAILNGNAVLIVEGKEKALKIRGSGFPGMSVNEAKNEQVIRGSMEGFGVSLKTNQVLIRKRLRSSELKAENMILGKRSKTSISILYMNEIVRPNILMEVKKRLKNFEIDGFMDSGIIEQLTSSNEWSLFPQYMTTERPDRAAQLLLEGHIVVITDNSPVALILPVNFSTFLKTPDDYYNRWGIATLERILRYIAVFFAVALPALYISVVNFRPEILPTNLIQVFITARSNIPYPVFAEVIIMEISFELIREAGVRIPGAMGNAIGIVGGLIVGSAAVEASLASPIIVIIVALTALCSFTIPNNEFSSSFRIIKFLLIVLSAVYGLYGCIFGLLLVLIHLSGLESYGFPYFMPIAGNEFNDNEDAKDFIYRMPYKYLTKRSVYAKGSNRRRLRVKNN